MEVRRLAGSKARAERLARGADPFGKRPDEVIAAERGDEPYLALARVEREWLELDRLVERDAVGRVEVRGRVQRRVRMCPDRVTGLVVFDGIAEIEHSVTVVVDVGRLVEPLWREGAQALLPRGSDRMVERVL